MISESEKENDDIALLFKKIEKTLSSKPIIKGVNFYVRKGEIFGYIGPNGAGKTTTIKLILGLLNLDKGKIEIFGNDISQIDIKTKKRISAVLDYNGLNSLLTVYEELGYFMQLYEIPNYKKKVMAWLEKMKLEDRKKDLVKHLSEGLKKKLAIAKAFAVNSEFIILDEPFINLDPTAQLEVRDMIYDISTKEGKTVFLSSHNLTHLQKVCSSLAFIDKGKIKEFGHMDEIVEKYTMPVFAVSVSKNDLQKLENVLKTMNEFKNRYLVKGDEIIIEEGTNDLFIRFSEISGKYNINILSMGQKEGSMEKIYKRIINEN